MKRHTKIYFKFFKIDYDPSGWHDFIPCEKCGNEAIDIHHINKRSQLGGDGIQNLIALCRLCHDLAHEEKLTIQELTEIHNKRIIQFKKW